MHHGTCVTHMPWCMSGSLTRGGGENRHSRRMRNPQFYVSGKRPMAAASHTCQLSPASSRPVSIADKTPNFNISWSLEVARFVFRTVRLLWYMTGTSAALLCYWPSVRGIHMSLADSPHKNQWRRALKLSLIWTNGCANNRLAGYLRRHRSHNDVIAMPECVHNWAL